MITRRTMGLMAALGIAAAPRMSAQQASPEKLLRLRYLSEVTGKIREYYLFLPRGYDDDPAKRWPLMMFLHGAGERGNGMEDLEKVLVHGPLMEAWIQRRELPCIIISPQAPFPEDRRNTTPLAAGFAEKRDPGATPPPRQAPKAETAPIPEDWGQLRDRGNLTVVNAWLRMRVELEFMLRTAIADYRVDRKRLYITGLSMGGFGTFGMAAHYPQVFAAVAPLCGGGDPASLDGLAKAGRPIWVYHGGRDRVVSPVESLRMANALLEKGHPDVRFTVHEDLGHNVWTRVYESEDFYRWLLAQSLP